ncbi:hypothetical protein FKM82_023384, partial [Ascaphus truei]
GRGRAKDCKCFLVTSKPEEAEKERINILQEQVMNDAVTQLQKLEGEAFLNKIRQLQKEEKKIRDFKKLCDVPQPTEGNKKLLCGKCKTFVCNTDDIRTIQVSCTKQNNKSSLLITSVLASNELLQKCITFK